MLYISCCQNYKIKENNVATVGYCGVFQERFSDKLKQNY